MACFALRPVSTALLMGLATQLPCHAGGGPGGGPDQGPKDHVVIPEEVANSAGAGGGIGPDQKKANTLVKQRAPRSGAVLKKAPATEAAGASAVPADSRPRKSASSTPQ